MAARAPALPGAARAPKISRKEEPVNLDNRSGEERREETTVCHNHKSHFILRVTNWHQNESYIVADLSD